MEGLSPCIWLCYYLEQPTSTEQAEMCRVGGLERLISYIIRSSLLGLNGACWLQEI